MMFARFMHTVSVQRAADVISADGQQTTTQSTVLAEMRCLVEPLSPKQIQFLVGRVNNPRFRITWSPRSDGKDPREGDRITFVGGPGLDVGLQCTLAEVLHDTMRIGSPAYKTGILEGHSR